MIELAGLPDTVRAVMTTRAGGVSVGQWASLNLGTHVDDDPVAVRANRKVVESALQAPVAWLNQVHGVVCVERTCAGEVPTADAQWTTQTNLALAVGVADCLAVGLCSPNGDRVGVAHAGWRGLLGGVIESTAQAMGGPLIAVLGPCIGPAVFQVGPEVREKFCNDNPAAASAFRADTGDRWLCDLRSLARQRLVSLGIRVVDDLNECTYGDPQRWFSYRRQAPGGRMAMLMLRRAT
ncbi:peptidoglycan editing factor PgeF [Litorivicinus lipolyticus]|uniref:Purine nucleoside phosphorylase n=1 Tax=Litorivicinus lipolyticus TaxID=418701 RepID=A0A5Q2QGD0_9GAMM|nr:peptidoglycan editing factor PgeF [Litorivicinus lipolyticus]QGG80890.1 peptidoglycan editing factor PgeF [Litorivicinus lipolyticus]